MCVCVCVCVLVEARGQSQLSLSGVLYVFVFWRQGLSLVGSLPSKLGWLSREHQGPLALVLRLQVFATLPGF